MIAYAESSAVLAWILGEPAGEAVRLQFVEAERVVSTTLTGVECARALALGRATGRIQSAGELAGLRLLEAAGATWATLELSGRVLERARAPFPIEPVRVLDALHLAAATVFMEAMPGLTMVTLDERVRANARALGMQVKP